MHLFFFGARNSGQPSLSADGFKLLFIRRVFFGGAWGGGVELSFQGHKCEFEVCS